MTDGLVTQVALETITTGSPSALVSQVALEVLSIEIFSPESRLTNNPLLYLFSERADPRLTQAAALCLYSNLPKPRTAQCPVLVLADSIPCIQRWAQCWKVTRLDGTVLGFTTHDQPITFGTTSYIPCGSLESSAIEMNALLKDAGSQELSGLISDSRVTAKDLAGGVYNGALVEVWLFPWSNAGGEIPVKVSKGCIGSIEQGEAMYKADVVSDAVMLGERSLLETVTPTCRYTFGESRCTIDLATVTVTGTVTATVTPNIRINASSRVFNDLTNLADNGYFDGGKLTWTSGDNAGQTSEIKTFLDGQFVLWDAVLNPIQIGDEYSASAGCNLTAEACKTKWNNYINFGGFPDVPGPDVTMQTPNQKG